MSDKVLLMLKITVKDKREFNAYWDEHLLPHWKKFAFYIGSYTPYVGESSNRIFRLFEYESMRHWLLWEEWLHKTDEGKALFASLAKYEIVSDRALLKPIGSERCDSLGGAA